MTSTTPPDDKTMETTTDQPHQPHILNQIVEEQNGKSASSPAISVSLATTSSPEPPSSPEPSSPPPTGKFEEGEGKYVCKLERKKSSIRRKRVLTAVTADDNKPVHIPLVEYGDQQDTYAEITQRVMHGADVTHGVRTLREKLGMLTAIRDACQRKLDVRLAHEDHIRRRVRMKRTLVMWAFGFVFLSLFVVILKVLFIAIKAYYGLIKDNIHQFRA